MQSTWHIEKKSKKLSFSLYFLSICKRESLHIGRLSACTKPKLPLVLQNMHWWYNRGKFDLEESCSKHLFINPVIILHTAAVRTKPINGGPRGVLTQTGPESVMPKSYKLLQCLNKTHINLSAVIFFLSVEISHFEVLPFNLHLTFVSYAPRRPVLTAEAFRSQRKAWGYRWHISTSVCGPGARLWSGELAVFVSPASDLPFTDWISAAQCQDML